MSNQRNPPVNGTVLYVPCQAEPGMFRGEWLVHLDAYSPEAPRDRVRTQMFVDERDVIGLKGNPAKNNPVPGWLRVEVAGGEGDYALVVLPQPAQPLGERVLIEKSLLRKDGAS